MKRCPLCSARLRNQASCSRCKAELNLLLSIESQAEQFARRAIYNLVNGRASTATRQAKAAAALDATPFHLALVGFCRAIRSDPGFCQPFSEVLSTHDSCTVSVGADVDS